MPSQSSTEAYARIRPAERERAERELQTVHAQLRDASRQAGMAEVATGVLNSVNVCATIISEKLAAGRLDNLARTADVLLGKGAALPEFRHSDAMGRLIPNDLADLARHLATQRQAAHLEPDLLMEDVEHLKEIVSMQQDFARIPGLPEPLPPDLLVEDALRITIADDGAGIAPENLPRIFGHGFGLHPAALAAKEMGGCLFAQGDGLARGATFTLGLPVAAMEAAA